MEQPLPILPRLDRLDRMLELLEERHSMSRSSASITTSDRDNDHKEKLVDHPNYKTLSSALDDVHYKGTLIDRLAILENRVLRLSLEMEEGSMSRSNSSTTYATYATKEEKELPIDKCGVKSSGKVRRRKPFKWMEWFSMGC